MEDSLLLTPKTLLVFIDETGNEDYSDPNNPTYGRGGCAVLGETYRDLLKKPWRRLKRERLGGATKPFHATEFERTRPTKAQITGISQFLKRPFWRFAVMSDGRFAFLVPYADMRSGVSDEITRQVTRAHCWRIDWDTLLPTGSYQQ